MTNKGFLKMLIDVLYIRNVDSSNDAKHMALDN